MCLLTYKKSEYLYSFWQLGFHRTLECIKHEQRFQHLVCHNDLYTVADHVKGGWEGNVTVFTGDTMPRWPSVDIDRTCVIRVDDISDKGNYS